MRLAVCRIASEKRVVAVAPDQAARTVDLTAVGCPATDGLLSLLTHDELFSQLPGWIDSAPAVDLNAATWCSPIPRPGKILCVGLNYADHARETGKQPPEEPLIFNKLSTTVAAHGEQIILPTISDQVDYEAELVAVIGRAGRNVPRDVALDYVAGYMCGNDISARDWQKNKPGGQWLLGKSFDSFAPTGPWFVSADEIDPHALDIQLTLNGLVRQQSNTSQLIFPLDYLVSYISQICTLLPGDLLFTGTPAGVGVGRDPQVFLQPGDVTEVEISGLGCLRNQFVSGQSVSTGRREGPA